jgi:hypothetical protein
VIYRMTAGILAALVLWTGFAVLGTPAQAQDRKTDKKAQDSELSKAAQQHFEDLEAALMESIKTWRAEQKAAVDAAIEKGGPIPAIAMSPPGKLLDEHKRHFIKATRTYAETDAVIPFHVWILRNSYGKQDERVVMASLSTLISEHVASPLMVDVPEAVAALSEKIGEPRMKSILKAIESKNKNSDVQGAAKLVRLRSVIQNAPISSKEYMMAKLELLGAKERVKDGDLASRIQATIDDREGLAGGDLAPEIDGVDMDGVAFKLSDYKGKVILLDFWGDW